MHHALLLAMNRETTYYVSIIAIVAFIFLVIMPIGIWFQNRKGETIDLGWQEVADRFKFRFTSESSSERAIQGEFEGSSFHVETSYERGGGGDGSGFDITTYSIQPKNIDKILTAGRRDIDHHAVHKQVNSESIKEVLGRVKKTAGCTLQYIDGRVVWSELYVATTQKHVTQRIEQMLDITKLLLKQGGPS